MRLIDADALIHKFCGEYCACEPKDCLGGKPCYKVILITDAPTIEQEETSTMKVDTSTNTPTDLISREDAIQTVRKELVCDGRHETHDKTCRFIADVLLSALPSAEPSRLTISKEEAEKLMIRPQEPNFIPQTKDCTDFLCWLLEEIMDEENWEMNAVADGEIIARKLKKLGLLEVKDGYYVRTPMYEALDAEPKRGEWELGEDMDGEYGICSACGNDADFSHYGKPYHYCPNCGAYMGVSE